MRLSKSAKSGLFTPKCLHFEGFSEDLLKFTLEISFLERETLFKVLKIGCNHFKCLSLSFRQVYFRKKHKYLIFQLFTAKILGK